MSLKGSTVPLAQRLAVRGAIEEVAAEYSYLLDRDQTEDLHEYFTEDGELIFLGKPPIAGREALRLHYKKGRDRAVEKPSNRRVRHLTTNLHVSWDSDTRVSTTRTVRYYMSEDPVANLTSASGLVEYDEVFQLVDGEWRFASRTIRPLFADPARAG